MCCDPYAANNGARRETACTLELATNRTNPVRLVRRRSKAGRANGTVGKTVERLTGPAVEDAV